ncbi:MAG: lipoate--protein ligase [Balneolales bacterium]|nr:lipoate--protein ligase [Balneolales bacterium]
MIFIENNNITDPRINLALEEYALKNFKAGQDFLLFYINEPSIIIGRNQNTLEEINHEYVEEHGIHVVRRMSGGGAVYHDLGNLNFSFITDYDMKSLNNFAKFTGPVIEVLKSMGIEAELSGRNDIIANGRKISGNAQYSTTKRMFSHGTLLFDTELGEVANALNVKMSKIQSKGHKSVRSRVANISEFLTEPMTTAAFRERLLKGLYNERADFETYKLTPADWEKVYALRDEKYGNWNWNYGRSPKFNIKREKRFAAGEVDIRLQVEKGIIQEATIFGDFFGKEPVSDIEDKLRGIRYEKSDIYEALSGIDLYLYFGEVKQNDFMNLIYGSDESDE